MGEGKDGFGLCNDTSGGMWKDDYSRGKVENTRKKVKSNNDNSEITFSPYYGLISKENTHSWIIR